MVGLIAMLAMSVLLTGCPYIDFLLTSTLMAINLDRSEIKRIQVNNARLISNAILKYWAVADQVKLGDSKQQVLAILSPVYKGIPQSLLKDSETYLKDGVIVDIYYARSAPYFSNRPKADEDFTPYVFHDGELVVIQHRTHPYGAFWGPRNP